jgi:hypothetical protein
MGTGVSLPQLPHTPAVQLLNSIFSAKTDPRENPEKNPVGNFDTT